MPLAVLTQSANPELRLREVAEVLETITDSRVKANLMAASSIFGELVLKPEIIKTILRSEIMKESAVYQEILQEGEQLGLLKGKLEGRLGGEREGKLKVGQQLLQLGMSLAQVVQVTGLSEEELGLLKGKLEGRLEGKLEIAQNLLQQGMSLPQVAQVTGLSEEELQQGLGR